MSDFLLPSSSADLVASCSVATEGGSVASDSYLTCLMKRLAPGLLSKLSSGSTESLKKVVNQPTRMITVFFVKSQ